MKASILIFLLLLGGLALAQNPDAVHKDFADAFKRRENANALFAQGKYAEAAEEYRAEHIIRERMQGPGGLDTLDSRTRLAAALLNGGKLTEAEKEYRAVVLMHERTRGPDDVHVLYGRASVAFVLEAQGKFAEAEKEYRAVLSEHERTQGAEHGNVFRSCYLLALCLEKQTKLKEALEFMARAEAGWAKLPRSHQPPSMDAKAARERIEAALSK